MLSGWWPNAPDSSRPQPIGAMLAVRLSEADLLPLLANVGLEIAAVNAPRTLCGIRHGCSGIGV